jgi:hypothetical protein
VFATCVASVRVSVPVVVTGEPDTEKVDGGAERATDVTPLFAIVIEPAPFVIDTPVPAVRVVTTGARPVDPISSAPSVMAAASVRVPAEVMTIRLLLDAVILLSGREGMSASTKARHVGTASTPVLGPIRAVLATCVEKASVTVPVVVTGEPDTEKVEEGADMATDVTPLFANVTVVPSCMTVSPVPAVRVLTAGLVPVVPDTICRSERAADSTMDPAYDTMIRSLLSAVIEFVPPLEMGMVGMHVRFRGPPAHSTSLTVIMLVTLVS